MYGVEVYIPWNNTWLDLPLLPDQGYGEGRMERTCIMFLSVSGGVFELYLLGGRRTDWNTGENTVTTGVWTLVWASGSQTYSWSYRFNPLLGR